MLAVATATGLALVASNRPRWRPERRALYPTCLDASSFVPAFSSDAVDLLRQGAEGFARALPDLQQGMAETAGLVASAPVVDQLQVGADELAHVLPDVQQAVADTAVPLLEQASRGLSEATLAADEPPAWAIDRSASPVTNPFRQGVSGLAQAVTDLQQALTETAESLLDRPDVVEAPPVIGSSQPVADELREGVTNELTRAWSDAPQAEAGQAALEVVSPAAPVAEAKAVETAPVVLSVAPETLSRSLADLRQAVAGKVAPVSDTLRPGAEQLARAFSAVQQKAAPVLERAAQEVRDQATVIAAKVATEVGAGLEAAAPVVRSQLEAAAKSGLDAAAPLVESGFAAMRIGLESTSDAAGSALSRQLSPDQLAAAEQAGRVASKLGKLAGTAAKGAVELGGAAVTAAAPVVGRWAAEGFVAGKQALQAGVPVLVESAKSLVETGQLPDETVRGLGAAAEQGSRGLLRGAASGFRSAASLLDDTPGQALTPGPLGIPSIPPLRVVTDQMASSFVRASAPYFLGLGLAGVALAAMRELTAPVEKVTRQAVALVTLALIARFVYDNLDSLTQLLAILSGEQSIKLF